MSFRQTYGSPLVQGKNRAVQGSSQPAMKQVSSVTSNLGSISSSPPSFTSSHLKQRNEELELTSKVLAAKNHAIAKKLSTVETSLNDAKRVIRDLRKELSHMKHSSAAALSKKKFDERGSSSLLCWKDREVKSQLSPRPKLPGQQLDHGILSANITVIANVAGIAGLCEPTTSGMPSPPSSPPLSTSAPPKLIPSPPVAPAPASLGPRNSRFVTDKPLQQILGDSDPTTTATTSSTVSSQLASPPLTKDSSPPWLSRLSQQPAVKDNFGGDETPLDSFSVLSPLAPAWMSPTEWPPSVGGASEPWEAPQQRKGLSSSSPLDLLSPLHASTSCDRLDLAASDIVVGADSHTPKQHSRRASPGPAPLAERRGDHSNVLNYLPSPGDIPDLKAQRRRSMFQVQVPASERIEAKENRRGSTGSLQGKENEQEQANVTGGGMGAADTGGGMGAVEVKEPTRSTSRRRSSVSVSYKEPALNTKVRKGHVFFPKTVLKSGTERGL